MSSMEANDLSKAIESARIEGALLRSQEAGKIEGRDETEKKFIKKLLKINSPEEISKDYEIPLERVLKIKNENS